MNLGVLVRVHPNLLATCGLHLPAGQERVQAEDKHSFGPQFDAVHQLV